MNFFLRVGFQRTKISYFRKPHGRFSTFKTSSSAVEVAATKDEVGAGTSLNSCVMMGSAIEAEF